jgi:hypothetical protein
MHRLAALVVVSLLAVPLFAADGYRFHIKVTDGETGLRANPQFAELHMSEAQVTKAADDRVLLLDHVEGARWNWLMVSWLYDGPPLAYAINDRGTARSAAAADVTLTPIDYKKFRLRCERDRCSVSTTSPDGREITQRLDRGETADMRFDSDVALSFGAEH